MIAKTYKNVTKIAKRSPIECALILMFSITVAYITLPGEVFARTDLRAHDASLALEVGALQNNFKSFGTLPKSDLRGPAYSITVPATAYNSLPEQTDDTPFITASGTRTRHGVIAANFLPFGTRVKIPEIYGDQIFIVEDRMNARYWKRIDIWMEHYSDAITFGYKNINIEVYPNQ